MDRVAGSSTSWLWLKGEGGGEGGTSVWVAREEVQDTS